jgi:prevent-host-death family protein
MKEVPISEFKANCGSILNQVRKTRRPIRITRFGKPIAEIVPPSPGKHARRLLGSMVGTAKILGDIVGPTGSLNDWDAFKD